MKDLFSANSTDYAKFRPGYPDDLFLYLKSLSYGRENAWDCGTGSGQVAGKLSKFFRSVYATDISEQQLKNAVQKRNIIFSTTG